MLLTVRRHVLISHSYKHYDDVIMGAVASQITSITIVYSTVCLFRCRSNKTSKLCVTGLCAGNSPGTGEFPAQMASNAGNVSIWWRHHEIIRGWPCLRCKSRQIHLCGFNDWASWFRHFWQSTSHKNACSKMDVKQCICIKFNQNLQCNTNNVRYYRIHQHTVLLKQTSK